MSAVLLALATANFFIAFVASYPPSSYNNLDLLAYIGNGLKAIFHTMVGALFLAAAYVL